MLIRDRRLREIRRGIYEGLTLKKRFEALKKSRVPKYLWKPPGGESYLERSKPMTKLLEEVKKKYRGRTILMVTHYGTASLIVTLLLKKHLKHVSRIKHRNASVTIIEINKNTPRALKINDTRHLK